MIASASLVVVENCAKCLWEIRYPGENHSKIQCRSKRYSFSRPIPLHISVFLFFGQVIDDIAGHTLAAASTLVKDVREGIDGSTATKVCAAV